MKQPSWETMTLVLFWSVGGVLLLVALSLLRACGAGRSTASVAALLRPSSRALVLHSASTEGPLDYAAASHAGCPRARPQCAPSRHSTSSSATARSDQESLSRLKHLVRISPVRNIALAVLFALHAGFACAQPSSLPDPEGREGISSRKW